MNFETAKNFFDYYAYDKNQALKNSKEYGTSKELIQEIENNKREIATYHDLFLVDDCLEDLKNLKKEK